MEKFVEITRKDKGYDKENAWFEHCQKLEIPFITVKGRGQLFSVQWDYMSYPIALDAILFSLESKIRPKIDAIYARYESPDTWFGIGPGVISFRNLESSIARVVAAELYDIIDLALQQEIQIASQA